MDSQKVVLPHYILVVNQDGTLKFARANTVETGHVIKFAAIADGIRVLSFTGAPENMTLPPDNVVLTISVSYPRTDGRQKLYDHLRYTLAIYSKSVAVGSPYPGRARFNIFIDNGEPLALSQVVPKRFVCQLLAATAADNSGVMSIKLAYLQGNSSLAITGDDSLIIEGVPSGLLLEKGALIVVEYHPKGMNTWFEYIAHSQ